MIECPDREHLTGNIRVSRNIPEGRDLTAKTESLADITITTREIQSRLGVVTNEGETGVVPEITETGREIGEVILGKGGITTGETTETGIVHIATKNLYSLKDRFTSLAKNKVVQIILMILLFVIKKKKKTVIKINQ